METPRVEAGVVEACRRGDRDAFRVLFEAYKDRVYSIALHYSGNEVAAHDIAQDVFVKLFKAMRRFRGDSSFDTWLYRMVVNACTDAYRRTRKWVAMGDEWSSVPDPHREPMEDRLQRRMVQAAVQKAVQRLSPRLRMPVVLRYVQGLSYDEIARALGCSKGTVASRLNRAHKQLARRLAHLEETWEKTDV